MIEAIGSLTVLGVTLGTLLGVSARFLKVEGNPLAGQLEEVLPGTNCGQCGYPGCAVAAEKLAEGQAAPTLCPPGGKAVAEALGRTLGVEVDLTAVEDKEPEVAFVNEDLCIGCARCFQKCPTDALVGAPKQVHTVIADICTGCRNCVDVCPTECIAMQPIEPTLQTWHWPSPEKKLPEAA